MKINSLGIEWTVRLSSDIEDNGFTDYEKQEIVISSNLSPEMQDAVLLHELFHTINPTMDHALLDITAMGLYHVLKQNNLWRSPSITQD